jgi:hypothetical protein
MKIKNLRNYNDCFKFQYFPPNLFCYNYINHLYFKRESIYFIFLGGKVVVKNLEYYRSQCL